MGVFSIIIVVLELVLLRNFKSYYKMSMRTLNHLIRWRNRLMC